MNMGKCFFGCEEPTVKAWKVFQPENIAELGAILYFCEYHGMALDEFANSKECDGCLDDNTIVPFIEKYYSDKIGLTCAVCMLKADRARFGEAWCETHYQTAKLIALTSPH